MSRLTDRLNRWAVELSDEGGPRQIKRAELLRSAAELIHAVETELAASADALASDKTPVRDALTRANAVED